MGDSKGTIPNGGRTISCPKGSYWINQGRSPCQSNGITKFRNTDGTLISLSALITRGFKPGYTIATTEGRSIGTGGNGGNGGGAAYARNLGISISAESLSVCVGGAGGAGTLSGGSGGGAAGTGITIGVTNYYFGGRGGNAGSSGFSEDPAAGCRRFRGSAASTRCSVRISGDSPDRQPSGYVRT